MAVKRESERIPTENRRLIAKYPNVYDYIEHKLAHMRNHFVALGDEASGVIFQDILDQYLSGNILVTFIDGDAYYAHIEVEEVNNNNDLTGSQ